MAGMPLLAQEGEPVSFAIVIPSYNNEKWCIGNLESCVRQKYTDFTIYYIDDCSQDRTGPLVDAYVKRHNLEKKCIVIHNKERRGALANLDSIIRMLDPKKVVVTVDGDDTLAHSHVLKKLAAVYADSLVWMTYGSWKSHPKGFECPCEAIPASIASTNSFRSYKWVSSQLRTFYAALFQKIKPEDLLWEGKHFPVAWDLAMMFPMLEMAAKGHFRYIPNILYIYNVINPINEFRARFNLQVHYDNLIRTKPPYQPLDTLFVVR
jgi:glycosyltransferase involved in cell wall biosynthesis